ncbi:pilus assembly protein, partial [Steroidobacter sp.]|uniref:pilus assembly protein n=1 Tax=Steroidobacter sp. TaxID=1978227 RepID=UPI001A40F8FD
SVLRSIVDRTSTASAAALNSGSISTQSLIYQARFRSADWTGQLLSYGINPENGELIGSTVRDAADRIPAPGARNIFTRNSAGTAVPFTWSGNLESDTTRVQELAPGTFATPALRATEAERMLNYLRGVDTNEGTVAGNYRVRRDPDGANKLGDIVNSAPLFVGKPPFRYPDSLEAASYRAFQTAQASRASMIYVGANDGMLHGFYADGTNRGNEAFSYIPGAVFPRLRLLAAQDYGHQFYVDGSPSMGDAYFAPRGVGSKAWRTVIAGGLNKGGQGIYAIDVTNPESVTASQMLWEFTDATDRDLGYTYSQPIIQKLHDGKWYVIFGNGYNSMQSDTYTSTTGNAVLFLVDLETGVARKLDTGVGYNATGTIPYGNGLSTPTVVDVEGDHVVDYVYAGDLYGNMWKFDLTATSSTAWNVAFSGQPLFTARDGSNNVQPITTRPEVTRGPQGNGQMVLFGTGKYLEASDKLRTPQVTQSFYGIVDRNARVTYPLNTRSPTLTRQTILDEVTVTKTNSNGTSTTSTVRTSTDNSLGAGLGWYMDLVSPTRGYQAEKQVTNSTVRDGKIIFTTLIPDADACGFGGSSWLMELDALDGSRLGESPFDLNRDGLFSTDDNVPETAAGPNVPASGLGSQDNEYGILPTPAIATGEFGPAGSGTAVQYKYLPGSSGNIMVVVENPGIGGTGRQSWRQIR